MAVIERCISPDGVLNLVVDRDDDGDLLVGFEGLHWHTHGDLLTGMYGGTPETAVRAFVADILSSKHVIVISRVGGEVCDVWVSDDTKEEGMSDSDPTEGIEKRYWNGRQFDG